MAHKLFEPWVKCRATLRNKWGIYKVTTNRKHVQKLTYMKTTSTVISVGYFHICLKAKLWVAERVICLVSIFLATPSDCNSLKCETLLVLSQHATKPSCMSSNRFGDFSHSCKMFFPNMCNKYTELRHRQQYVDLGCTTYEWEQYVNAFMQQQFAPWFCLGAAKSRFSFICYYYYYHCSAFDDE